MYSVYILRSTKNGRYYIGQTRNLSDRIYRHNHKGSIYSKKFAPWDLIYTEEYQSRQGAIKRELEIKSYRGGIKFKKLLGFWKD